MTPIANNTNQDDTADPTQHNDAERRGTYTVAPTPNARSKSEGPLKSVTYAGRGPGWGTHGRQTMPTPN